MRKYKTKSAKCSVPRYSRTAECRRRGSSKVLAPHPHRAAPAATRAAACMLQRPELESMTVAQLRRLAAKMGVDLRRLVRPLKADIVNAIINKKPPCAPESVHVVEPASKSKEVVAEIELPKGNKAEGAGIIVDVAPSGQTVKSLANFVMVEDKKNGKIVVTGTAPMKQDKQEYLTSVYSHVQQANPTFIFDKQCTVRDQSLEKTGDLLMVSNSKRSAVLKQCTRYDSEGMWDCEHNLLHIAHLPDPNAAQEWREGLEFYQECRNTMPEHVLQVVAAWTCDSSAFRYNTGTVFNDWKQGASLVGFTVVAIPQGYRFMMLRDFMRNATDPSRAGMARTAYNWVASTVTSKMIDNRYMESGMPRLLEAMYAKLETIPSVLSPNDFGVLIRIGAPYANAYASVVLPGFARQHHFLDPTEIPYVEERLTMDRQAIVNIVKGI